MFEKILNKLGIFDLIAVLLSGICISTFTFLISKCIHMNFSNTCIIDMNFFNTTNTINDTLSFLVISYFIGLIFQEGGSFLQKKILHRNNTLLKNALAVSTNSHTLLTSFEKLSIYNHVTQKLHLDETQDIDNIVYNYCKYYIIKKLDTTQIDRYQSLSILSRSLFLYFTLMAITTFITLFISPSLFELILFIIFLIFSLLFYYRFIRLIKLRYINILRTYFYNAVVRY